ncbi:MAG: hypothetical protein ACJAR1_000061 [Rubritalea sp.]|jgi:uncharacterized protein with ParB-like and HNH nuclease domain
MDVSPQNQNIAEVFSSKTYHIDFYQRDYRWTEEPVIRLMDDIFFKFTEQYESSKDLDATKETIIGHYPWYYLNTYVTNDVMGRTFIVDGQQRLTTLTLVLIKLYHLSSDFGSKLNKGIESKIGGQEDFEYNFWMNHVGHKATQQALFEDPKGEIPTESGITAQNMEHNYSLINSYLDKKLKDKHSFETFAIYFLYRLVLINLKVEQTDVPMVFEVINDRGVRLKPYEILKGKLLGQISKDELRSGNYNDIWEDRANTINSYKDDEMDAFFRFYLKSKYANSRKEGQQFDGDYHRVMFSSKMNDELGLLNDAQRVKQFLKGEFDYYSQLFVKLRNHYGKDQQEFRGLLYTELLDLDAPFLLILSACIENDPDEDEKIRQISSEIDRLYTLLQLQNVYDSNEFAVSLFDISELIRNGTVESIRPAFDTILKKTISKRKNVDTPDSLSYTAFRQTGISLNIKFKRYFFGRIDEFLAKETNTNARHDLSALVKNRGNVNGFHIEHILAHNEESLMAFDNDDETFQQQRNRLGAIILLKGKDNISSNNEVYSEKLKSYASTLIWNETLREDCYKSKLDLRDLKARYNLDLKALNQYGPDEIEQRHKLLFEIVKIIWA